MFEVCFNLVQVIIVVVIVLKFNVVIIVIDGVLVDVCVGKGGEVFVYLCDVYYLLVYDLGYGVGYCYVYNFLYGVVKQQYLFDDIVLIWYYDLIDYGNEVVIV